MKLKPGHVVALEGLDATGKTTQLDMLRKQFPDDFFIHQPSGGTVVGDVIYQLTEQVEKMHPLTRQLLHLASHTEQYDRLIVPALNGSGVFMDRCWWSTLAYGWYAGGLRYLFDYEDYERLCKVPTQGVEPDVVLVFMDPYDEDNHNTKELVDGYTELLEAQAAAYRVPKGTVDEVNAAIIGRLHEHQLIL